MTIRHRLIILNAIITLLLVGAVAIAGYRNGKVKAMNITVEEENVHFATLGAQMKLEIVQVQQWLTDISATRAMDGLDDGFVEAEANYSSFMEELHQFEEYFERVDDSEGVAQINEIRTAMETYYEVGKKMAQGYIDGGPAVGNTLMASFDDASANLQERFTPFIEQQKEKLADAMHVIDDELDRTTHLLLITTLISILCAVSLGVNILRSITSGIGEVVSFSNKLEQGVISIEIPERADELNSIVKALNTLEDNLREKSVVADKIASGDLTDSGRLASPEDVLGISLEQMVNNLRDIVTSISEATLRVTSGSATISDSAQALSQGATEQAATLEEVAASVNSIGSQAKENAEKAKEVQAVSAQATQSAEKSQNRMEQMKNAMEKISVNSAEVRKVVKTIDDIAFQTNLLALNAAVEAARAGQHGKGFAVVADEVRNLAGRSAKAAKETEELIEESYQNIKDGVEISVATDQALNDIVENINDTSSVITLIAEASVKQSDNIDQIACALEQVDVVVQQSMESSEELAQTSSDMNSQAQYLGEMVHRFNIGKSEQAPVLTLAENRVAGDVPQLKMDY